MDKLKVICTGSKTCLEECICKEPHTPIRNSSCDDPGSCYHNNHSDGKFHEEGHILVQHGVPS